MLITVLFLLAILGALLALVVLIVSRDRDLAQDVEEAKAETIAHEFEEARLRQHAESVLIPLGWIRDLIGAEAGDVLLPAARLQAYLTQAYVEVQLSLLLDDVEMTDLVHDATAILPPRRLPKYPQTPPFLATPEDIAGVPTGGIIQVPFDPADTRHAPGVTRDRFDVI